MRVLVLLTLLLTAIGIAVSCVPDYTFNPRPGTGGSGSGGGPPATAGAASGGLGGQPSTFGCSDNEQNGNETDKDCGGSCPPCAVGKRCRTADDCEIRSCTGEDSICQAPHCLDEAINFNESDFDCGSDDCVKCRVGQKCLDDDGCTSNACEDNLCIPTGCDDGKPTGDETGIDCGGETYCPRCGIGQACKTGGDCALENCYQSTCTTVECTDQEFTEGEEGVDCGGVCPKQCTPEQDCKDGRRNGKETDKDCGGGECDACGDGKNCARDEDCESAYCFEDKCTPEACREDPDSCVPVGTGGGGGTGGNPGIPSGGTGGTSGESGDPGGGTSGGTAGAENGGTGGTGDPPLTVCTGCARLVVPLSAPEQIANYMILLRGTSNFSNAQITFRVYKEAGTGGALKGFVQYGGNPDFRQVFQRDSKRLSDVKGWTEFTWNVAAQPMTDFNKTNVARIGLQVLADVDTEVSNTVIYVDRISVSGASGVYLGPWDFAAQSSTAGGDNQPGPDVLWLNTRDNPVAGSRLEWLGGAEPE